tara:strand:- start:888 stop:1355 length:468 start_codon:yes stop_codon:yes gene_type:complete
MDIPLTSFIDFVLKSGSPKMTSAKKIKSQSEEDYNVATDYYKRFREAVQELHKKDLQKATLLKLVGPLPPNKVENYKKMAEGYKKFLGKKEVKWFKPSRENWKQGNLTIAINPELGSPFRQPLEKESRSDRSLEIEKTEIANSLIDRTKKNAYCL